MFHAVPEHGKWGGAQGLQPQQGPWLSSATPPQLPRPLVLTSAISIFPSEFLSYFCMNSFIFSPKLSLLDICGQRKEADLAAMLHRIEDLSEAGLGIILCAEHMVQKRVAPVLRGSVSALDLSHMIIKGTQDVWACSVPCN